MKKHLSVLTAALIALSTCSGLTGKSVLAEDVYYSVPVQNAGLEESGGADTLPGFTDETIYTTGYTDVTFDKSAYSFVEITDAQAHTGCKSLRVFDGTHYGSARALTNAIPITKATGVQYTASFWANVPTTPVNNPRGAAQNVTKLKVRFKCYHANGAIRTTIGTAVNVAASANGWQQYEVPAFIPSNDASYIKLEFYSDTADYVDAYIDDIEIKKVNVEYTNSASETPKTYNRVSLNNADFENAVNSSWSLVSPTEPTDANKIEFVSDKGFNASKSMHFINTASGATKAVSEYYTASAGDTFRGSFKAYLDTASITNTTSEAMYAKLSFYNSSKTLLSTASTDLYKKVFKDDANARWISLWFDEKTAPANTAFVRVEFYCLAASRADAYIDDVVLYSTGTCEAEPIPATYTDIEVPNPGFENGIESWELYSDYALDETVNYEIAEDIVNSGSKSLRIYDGNKEDGDVLLASPRLQ